MTPNVDKEIWALNKEPPEGDTPKRRIRTRDELKDAIESGEHTPDLQKEVEERVKMVQQKQAEHEVLKNRIRSGLAGNGKQLRRNAKCPCGSLRKFKKCCLPKLKGAKDQVAARLVPAERGSAGPGKACQGTDSQAENE